MNRGDAFAVGGMSNMAFRYAASPSIKSRMAKGGEPQKYSSMFCPVTMRMGRIFAYALTGICAFRLAMRRMFVVNLSFVLSTLWSAVACVAFQLSPPHRTGTVPAPVRVGVTQRVNEVFFGRFAVPPVLHALIEQIPPDTLLRHGHVFKLHHMPYIVDGDALIVELNAAFVSFGFCCAPSTRPPIN